MSNAIGLFSGYSGGENRTTNYCLLVMKRMQSSKRYFNVASTGADGAAGLANMLRGRTWNEFE